MQYYALEFYIYANSMINNYIINTSNIKQK